MSERDTAPEGEQAEKPRPEPHLVGGEASLEADSEPLVEDQEELELTPEEQEIATLKAELRDNTARLRTVSVAYRKLQEEFGGFRERQGRQANVQKEMLKGDTVQRLFEPMENLRRSIDALATEGLGEEALGGLEMVWREFLAGFKDLGLEELGQTGELFDPDVHEALSILPVDDPRLDSRIVEVFSKGYRVGSRLVRPARVIIGQHHEEPVGEA